MTTTLRWSLLAGFFVLATSAIAQLSVPSIIDVPKFDMATKTMKLDKGLDYKSDKLSKGKRVEDRVWSVFTDRDNVPVFADKKLRTNKNAPISSIGTMLAVDDETDNAMLVLRAGQPVGWVSKEFLVVWDRPLIKYGTAVDIKAFIVNQQNKSFFDKIGDDVSLKDYYRIFPTPGADKPRETDKIYQVLFVYKHDTKSQRYLLSNNYRLTADDQLLGWVDYDRVQEWDSALALEPNWDKDSRNERAATGQIASVFRTSKQASEHYNGDDAVAALISRDPANADLEDFNALLHPSGRYYGDIPRFPFFSQTRNIIICGAVGKASVSNLQIDGANELQLQLLTKDLEKRQKNQKNTSVVFVVDGTKGMTSHYTAIMQSVDQIYEATEAGLKSNLKFGLVVYADNTCGSSETNIILKTTELTSDRDNFKKRIKALAVRPNLRQDGDLAAAAHYGIHKALVSLGLNSYDNNILMHIGRASDISLITKRRVCEKRPMVDESELQLALNEMRPAMIAIQAEYDPEDKDSKRFEDDNVALMLNLAKRIGDKEREKFAMYGADDTIIAEAIAENGIINITNAPSLMRVYTQDRPSTKSKMSADQLMSFILEAYQDCLAANEREIALLKELCHDSSELGKYVEGFSTELMNSLSGVPSESLRLLGQKRVHLFSKAYTYTRHPQANYDSYRQVLFLKKSSILALRSLFKGLENSNDQADVMDRKDGLKQALKSYVQTVLNIDGLEVGKIDIAEVRKQITGVMTEGVMNISSDNLLSRLTSLDDIDRLSNDEVFELYEELRKKGIQFNAEVGRSYPFIYKAGIGEASDGEELEFYWVPIEILL